MNEQRTEDKQHTEIVVIGAGYAGLLATVRLAGKLRTTPVNITLVNSSDVFVERLRLHQFAANHAVVRRPLEKALQGTGVKIALGPHNAIGFNNFPDDKPRLPYFTGRTGYEGREFFVRLLAAMPGFERRWPGAFFWLGTGRYAAAQRRLERERRVQVDTSR
jgi:hypothetical protein